MEGAIYLIGNIFGEKLMGQLSMYFCNYYLCTRKT